MGPIKQVGAPVVDTIGPTSYVDTKMMMFDDAFPPLKNKFDPTNLFSPEHQCQADRAEECLIALSSRSPSLGSFLHL
jgi:hypothetical protein